MSAAAETPGQELTRAATQAREAEAPRALAAVPQYATGFEGAAAAPFPAEAAAILAAPVNEGEVEVRPDGIVYLPGVAYRRILTRAFGAGAWALLPRGPSRRDGDVVLYHGALYILGRFVSEAMGECEARFGMTYASALEGARTDALTRCCKDLGIATELWGPAWRDGWLKKHTDREWVPPDGNKKGKWKYWLKDKAGGATLISGRNVGTPKGEATAAVDAALAEVQQQNAQSAAPHDSAPSDVPVVGSDTGEAPEEELIHELQAAAVALRWKGPRAKNWLAKHFGVQAANALTKRQAEDALSLLKAQAVDDMDKSYGELMDRLVAEGRVSR